MKTFLFTLDSFEEETLIRLSKQNGFEDIESFIENLIKLECENQYHIKFLENLDEELLIMRDSTVFSFLTLIDMFKYSNVSQFMMIELQEIFEAYIFNNQKNFLIKKAHFDYGNGRQYYVKIR